MRSKLGLAIAFVIALALGTSGALANGTGKIQNTNSSTTMTTTTKVSKNKRRYSRRKHHRRNRMKRNSAKNANSNTRT